MLKPPETYDRNDLKRLIDRLKHNDSKAITEAVAFMMVETRGIWHGRARAKICRTLKHCTVSQTYQARLVQIIGHRLSTGLFSEQFKDQLRTAIRFRPNSMRKIAVLAMQESPKHHVQRYAKWVIDRVDEAWPDLQGPTKKASSPEQTFSSLIRRGRKC